MPDRLLGSEVAELRRGDQGRRSRRVFGGWEALRRWLTNLSKAGVLAPTADPKALATSLIVALQGGLLLGKIHRTSRPTKSRPGQRDRLRGKLRRR